MDTVVDLSNWDGSFVHLTFVATDSAGQTTTIPKGAYVISNTNVIEVDRVSLGNICDVSESKILFTPNPNVLKSKSRLTGAETTLVNDPGIHINGAALTLHGAIFSTQTAWGGGVFGLPNELYEVRDGTLIDLGAYQENLVVKGNYAIWITATNGVTTLTLRDLLSGTNVVVSSTAGNTSNDVAANGDVVYWGANDYQIYRYRNGVSTKLANGIYPITDGVNVGYFTGSPPSFSNFALFDGTNEIILGPRPADDTHALSEGWTAFVKPGTGQNQIWTRSPSGVQTQRTFFGSSSILYALGPSGDLMISYQNRLYFIPNGSPPNDLGPWGVQAVPFWIKGNWYASLGSSLVAFVVPSAPTISPSGWNTNGQFSFHIAAGLGQQVVTQESTDLFRWTSLITNFVSTTSGIDAAFPPASGSNKKFYRVISVH